MPLSEKLPPRFRAGGLFKPSYGVTRNGLGLNPPGVNDAHVFRRVVNAPLFFAVKVGVVSF